MDIFKDRQTQLILVGSIILAMLMYFVGIDSFSSKLSTDNAKYITLQQQLDGLNSTVLQYQSVAGRKVSIIDSLKNFETMVPQQLEFGTVSVQLAALATRLGVTVTSFTIGAVAPNSAGQSSLVQPVTLNFGITGPYSNYVGQFLPALYNGTPSFPRLLVIDTLTIPIGTVQPNGSITPPSTISTNISATIFFAPTVTPVASS